MTGMSGCFGSKPKDEVIDSAAEVSAAVDDIVETPSVGTATDDAAFLLAQHYAYMEKRVRMLTWAVVALAAVVLMKEL